MIDTLKRVTTESGHTVGGADDEALVGRGGGGGRAARGRPAPDSEHTATRALLNLKRYQLEAEFAAQWERRHPIYAKLLNSPVVGSRLRTRRAKYLNRMMTIRGIE
jgi:hypothetical protein